MKFTLLFSLALSLAAFAPKSPKAFVPPGTVRISDSLYMDEIEVSNFAWREYESWLKQKYGSNSPEHVASLPDTLVWRMPLTYNEPYVEYYYRHPAYSNFPVVGISYEQAMAYCQWRSERVKETLCLHKKYEALNFEYRLPSKIEWEFCCGNGGSTFLNKGLDNKHQPLCNIRRPVDSLLHQPKNADVTCPVTLYPQGSFGLRSMIGNVAEMTASKGLAKGGGWTHTLEQCRPGNDISYTKVEPWLGFRCVCIIRMKN